MKFDRVWVVFDKDDFNDFNEAIALAGRKGYGAAWSNEAFELWYLLHFIYLDAAISRADYITILEENIRRLEEYKDFKYHKNDEGIYSLLKRVGNEDLAKERAQKLRRFFEHSLDYKAHKPCTTVDVLVEELEHPENLLTAVR